jgi:succinate dehydrogenase/fumarate reductase flavoprotein subunit
VTLPRIQEIERLAADVLVVGGGIAGFQAAVAAAKAGATVVVAHAAFGASPYVLGVNAPLAHEDPADTPAIYADDMVRGGYAINDRRLVRVLSEEAAPAALELAALGVPFAAANGRFRQRHLSGNTYPRSLYVADGTGRAILDRLTETAETLGVSRLSGYRALRLLQDDGVVRGALLFSKQRDSLLAVSAGAVVLATGGIGRIYEDSTYPVDVASDSYALALESGARLIDMEFVQFEPTVTVYPTECRGLEMPTAMLGDGAHLINAAGERFMLRYNPEHAEKRIEKAKLSLCIQQEIDEGRGFSDRSVIFDTTVLDAATLEGYVTHCRRLRAGGLDPARQSPRIRPAAHSAMGGVLIDEGCRSDVPGLSVCGEASGGVHGASRLAGNGGGEIVTFGRVAGHAVGRVRGAAFDPVPSARAALAALRDLCRRPADGDPADTAAALGAMMTASCGLYREAGGLTALLDRIRGARADWRGGDAAESLADLAVNRSLSNMLLTAETIAAAALMRTESRGAQQRRDFPTRDDAHWTRHIATTYGSGGALVRTTIPIQ